MKVIVSHDVDYLTPQEHIFKDLILEKLFVRSILQFLQRKISFKSMLYRCTMVFHKKMNNLEAVMGYDKKHNIPATFFFGMSNVLGMSYSKKTAIPYIKKVYNDGFDVGVHGCEYVDINKMNKEYNDFKELTQIEKFGIRNHYVRFDNQTFEKMSNIGYLFDSTEFDKKETSLANPYKVGNMWEFPLHIMDVYVCKQGEQKESLNKTFDIISEAEKKGIKYLTILFHDCRYNEIEDPQRKEWYEKTIEYCENKGYEFISYRDAIKELEHENNRLCQ